VSFLEPFAAVHVVVERAAGDGAIDVLDQAAGTVRHVGIVALEWHARYRSAVRAR